MVQSSKRSSPCPVLILVIHSDRSLILPKMFFITPRALLLLKARSSCRLTRSKSGSSIARQPLSNDLAFSDDNNSSVRYRETLGIFFDIDAELCAGFDDYTFIDDRITDDCVRTDYNIGHD